MGQCRDQYDWASNCLEDDNCDEDTWRFAAYVIEESQDNDFCDCTDQCELVNEGRLTT